MKTSTLVASIAAGVVVVGGGIWAATTLPANDETAYTGAYEPAAIETPAASAAPTEPVETPTPEPSEAPETVEPTPGAELSDGEAELVWLTQTQLLADLELSEEEILTAAAVVCDAPAGTSYDTLELRGADDADLRQFWTDAKYHAC